MGTNTRHYFLFVLIVFSNLYVFAAPPGNDNPCTPFILSTNATCTYTTYTNAAATSTSGIPAPGCANYSGGDVWFSVLVPANGNVTINTQTGVITDGGMAAYSGTSCSGPFSIITCSDDDSENGLMPKIALFGRTPGEVIWIRFWEYGNDNNGTFGICVTSPLLPPPNDICANAEVVTPNTTIATCIPGTTDGAADDWSGTVGCQLVDGTPEVWYTFTATGTDFNYNITSSGGAAFGNAEIILVSGGSCGTTFTLEGSNCGPVPLVGSIGGLTVGTVYHYTISNNGVPGNFTSCIINNTPPPAPGQDCANAATLCNNNSFHQNATSGIGAVDNTSTNTCLLGDEHNSKWYKFTIGCSGTLGFRIEPDVAANDFDWAVWNTPCAVVMPTPIACNWSSCAGATGLSAAYASESNCSNWAQWENAPAGSGDYNLLNVVAGQTITILIDNFSPGASGFTLSFEGTAIIGPSDVFTMSGGTTCPQIVTLQHTCATPNTNFLWNMGNGNTLLGPGPMSYTYPTPGAYTISLGVADALNCTAISSASLTDPTPTPAKAGPDQNVCADGAKLAGNKAIRGVGRWTVIAGPATVTVQTDSLSPVTGLGVGVNTFRWTIDNGTCSSFDDITITRGAGLPSAPTLSAGTITTSSIQFNWTAVAGATSYEFSKDSIDPLSWTADTDFTETLSGFAPNTKHCAWVRAINGCDTMTTIGLCPPTLNNCVTPITYTKSKDTATCISPYSINVSLTNISPSSYKISWEGGPLARNTTYNSSGSVDHTIYFTVRDSISGCGKSDSIRINYVPVNNTGWSGLSSTYCTASYTSILTPNQIGGIFSGPGVGYNPVSSQWYFKPSIAGAGTHTIIYTICGVSNPQTTTVQPAPCVTSVVTDSTSSAVQTPQGLFTDCQGQIYVSNAKNDIISLIDTLGNASVVAGDSTFAGAYADGNSSVARINDPIGITVGPDKTVYFVDSGNQSVRKLSGGIITTMAGAFPVAASGIAVPGPVNGSMARFNKPYGITMRPPAYDKLYVSDQGNGRIREIDINPPYSVRTIVGGGLTNITALAGIPALTGKLYKPSHISISTDGNYLYISDETPNVIYVYEFATDLVKPYAGTFGIAGTTTGLVPGAQFNLPSGVSVNCNGDVYVADKGNNSIKLIDPNIFSPGRFVSNFAGSNNPLAPGDVDGPPAVARFNSPQAVSVFVKGFIDIADTGNDKIKRLSIQDYTLRPWATLQPDFTYCSNDPRDTLVVICGGIYSGPGIVNAGGVVAFDPLVAGPGVHTLVYTYTTGYCVEVNTQVVTVHPNPVPVLSPTNIQVCANLFGTYQLDAGAGFASYTWYKNSVHKVRDTMRYYTVDSPATYVVSVTNSFGCMGTDTIVIASKPVTQINLSGLDSLCYGDSTTLQITNASSFDPTSFNWNTGQTSSSIVASASGDYIVIATAPAPNSCTDTAKFRVTERYAPTICMSAATMKNVNLGYGLYGNSILAGPGAQGLPSAIAFANLWDVYFDKSGQYLYLTEEGSRNDVRRIRLSDTTITTFAGVVGPGAYVNGPALTSSKFNHPYGIVENTAGKFFVADRFNQDVRSLDPSLNVAKPFAGYPGLASPGFPGYKNGKDTSARFNDPFDMTMDVFGNIYLTDYTNNLIRKITPQGIVSTIAGDTSLSNYAVQNGKAYSAWFNVPVGIDYDVEGNLFVTDAQGTTLRRINPDTVVTTFASGFTRPWNIVTDKTGNIYVSDLGANSIKKIDKNKNVTTIATGIISPRGITIDPVTERIYVAEYGSNRIQSLIKNKTVSLCKGDSIKIDARCSNMKFYAWTQKPAGPSSLNNTAIANPIAFPKVTTTYILTVTDFNGCKNTDSITVVVNPLPIADAGFDKQICPGDSVGIGALPVLGYKYSWTSSIAPKYLSNDTISNPYAKPPGIGTVPRIVDYYLTMINRTNSCYSDQDTVKVTVNPLPIFTAGGPKTLCFGDTVILGPPSGSYASYAWSPKNGLNDSTIYNPNASPGIDTTYYLTVTTANGCKKTDSARVTVVPKPSASFNILNACALDTVSFINNSTISPGTMTYGWDFGDTGSGTANTSTATNPTHRFSDTTKSYTIKLVVTSNSGCTAIAIESNFKPNPKPNAGFVYTIPCALGPIQFNDTTLGATSWEWRFGDPASGASDTVKPSQQKPSHLFVGTGPYTVTLIATTALGCKDTISKVVNPQYLRVNAGNDTTICIGKSAQLNARASGGNPGYTYGWTGPVVISNPLIVNPTVTPGVGANKYVVTVTDASLTCTSKDSLIVTVAPLPVVDAGLDTIGICLGKFAVLGGAPTASSAAGIKTILWNPTTSLSSTSIANPVVTPLANQKYFVTATDNIGCSKLDSVYVVIRPLPNVAISKNIPIGCSGNPVTLSVANSNSANTIVWTNVTAGNVIIGNNVTSTIITTEALYKVVITDPVTLCADSSTLYVDFITPPSAISIIAPDSNCVNQPVQLVAAAMGDSLKYIWTSTGTGTFDSLNNDTANYSPNPLDLINPLIPNPVNFTLTVYNSCDTLTANEDVVLKPAPIGSYTYAPTENFVNDTIYFTNTSDTVTYKILSWKWNFKDGVKDTSFHTLHAFQAPGIYNVDLAVTNNFACSYTYTLPIDIIRTQVIFIPNVFSPLANNADNKACRVFGLNISSQDFLFRVYNRWGDLLYETADFVQANTIGWSGNNQKGEVQAMGVYTYTLKAKWMDGTPIEKTGTTTLIR